MSGCVFSSFSTIELPCAADGIIRLSRFESERICTQSIRKDGGIREEDVGCTCYQYRLYTAAFAACTTVCVFRTVECEGDGGSIQYGQRKPVLGSNKLAVYFVIS